VAPKDLAKEKSGGFSNIHRLANGEIGIAWLGTFDDPKKEGRPLKFAQTTPDGGITPAQVIDKQSSECCRTAIASGQDGKVFVAFRDLLPKEIRDISLTISSDNGETFGQAHDFSKDYWEVNGCPHNGPSLVRAKHKIYAGWFTNSKKHRGVNFAVLDSTGQVMEHYNISSKGQFIQVGHSSNGRAIMA